MTSTFEGFARSFGGSSEPWKAGMHESRVAVVLPIFQRPEGEEAFIAKWAKTTQGRHRNVCFDVHCYHCFENQFHGKTFAEQLRAVEENSKMFQRYPMVAGEWALGLGRATWCTCGDMDEDTVISIFGAQQMEAFRNSSHGSFFWNWKEDPEDKEWNFQLAYEQGLLNRPALALPPWDHTGEDPLEDILHPSPEDPVVYYGLSVCTEESTQKVDCSWADKGQWQAFIFHEAWPCKEPRRPVKHRDIVRIQGHNKHFVAVTSLLARAFSPLMALQVPDPTLALQLLRLERYVATSAPKHQKRRRYFFSRATSTTIDADDEADGIFARWADFGDWQAITVERPPELQRAVALPQPLPQPRPRRRTKGHKENNNILLE
ncbi:unnamed protein product [Durusdinium trenchii]|uniref:glucan 1,3-beta-glucosidase n=1 Tax=Durusdinium trenchii TaxID=1381693 RepID=A0ABP0K042_9DINO